MDNPFNLTDATIRDLPHVTVTRQAPTQDRVCEYHKIFKPAGMGQANYWMQRENEFLLDFTIKRLKHTVELAAFAQGGGAQHTPIVSLVATRDAGITLEDWLNVRPHYEHGGVGRHPFQPGGTFLRLLRACLVALKEIHEHGIVHCDIKEDNICLPFTPYPHSENQWTELDFDRLRLIDFAFSITPERPLAHPLPILPTAAYQSALLKQALESDGAGRPRHGQWAVQQLDYRVDLYGLGHLAARLLDAGLLQPAGAAGRTALQGAQNMVERLLAGERDRKPSVLPHDGMLAEIDGWLEKLVDLEEYRRFQVRWTGESGLTEKTGVAGVGLSPTPMTQIAEAPEPETSEAIEKITPSAPAAKYGNARGLPRDTDYKAPTIGPILSVVFIGLICMSLIFQKQLNFEKLLGVFVSTIPDDFQQVADQGDAKLANLPPPITPSLTITRPSRIDGTHSPLAIGQSYQGGIIFYLDSTGQHGLIAAPSDVGTTSQWYNYSYVASGASGTAVGTGQVNTNKIIAVQGVGDYAATTVDYLNLKGFSDWFLPSKDELDLMYRNIGPAAPEPLTNIGGFGFDYYWSSSEYDYIDAWYQNFSDGLQSHYLKANDLRVRPVRAF